MKVTQSLDWECSEVWRPAFADGRYVVLLPHVIYSCRQQRNFHHVVSRSHDPASISALHSTCQGAYLRSR